MKKILSTLCLLCLCLNGFAESRKIADLRKKAEAGDAGAQFNLGNVYYSGKVVPRDFKEAAKWYRIAVDQGHAVAQHNLGLMYNFGIGVPIDVKEAAKWYRKAAEQGHADSQWFLGSMYAGGEGVPKDDVAAYAWYSVSGFGMGEFSRAEIAKKMTPEQIAKGKELAKELLKKIEANKAKQKK